MIGEALDRIEVLVVLDGSKDGSAEIAYEFVEQYPDTSGSFIRRMVVMVQQSTQVL